MAYFKAGIWLILRPGFGILTEKGDEIRDCYYDRDTGFGDFNRGESGNVALKNRDSGIPETEILKKAVILAHLINVENSRTMMIQMVDRLNTTPIGQDKKTLTFKALLLREYVF